MTARTTRNNARRRAQRNNNNPRNDTMGDLQVYGRNRGAVVSRPFTTMFTPDRPGRASLRTTFEAIGTPRALQLANVPGAAGFPDWFPQMVALLSPFSFFRITRLRFVTQVTGGAASLYTVTANVTNDNTSTDTSALAILNDDFAGVANAVTPLVLEPPVGYFQQGSLKWYPTVTTSLDSIDFSMGTLCAIGFGGSLPATVIGWHTVDVEVEFHTLR